MKRFLRASILAGVALVGLSGVSVAAIPADTSDPSYRKGSYDRDGWESWFTGLSGDRLAGASYWAENRSKNPIPCFQLAGTNYTWLSGCNEASRRLSLIDFQRKTDGQYWNGWNKKVAPPPFVPGIPGEAAPYAYVPTTTYPPAAPAIYVPPAVATPEPAQTRASATSYCASKAANEIGGRFDAYYDTTFEGWKTFGGNGGTFYFGKCMSERGYAIGATTSG